MLLPLFVVCAGGFYFIICVWLMLFAAFAVSCVCCDCVCGLLHRVLGFVVMVCLFWVWVGWLLVLCCLLIVLLDDMWCLVDVGYWFVIVAGCLLGDCCFACI